MVKEREVHFVSDGRNFRDLDIFSVSYLDGMRDEAGKFVNPDLVCFGSEYNFPNLRVHCATGGIPISQEECLENFVKGILDGAHIGESRIVYVVSPPDIQSIETQAQVLRSYGFEVISPESRRIRRNRNH